MKLIVFLLFATSGGAYFAYTQAEFGLACANAFMAGTFFEDLIARLFRKYVPEVPYGQ